MILVNHIRAKNSNYGNPQRGYIIYELADNSAHAGIIDFIDEGYAGSSQVRDKYPSAIFVGEIDVEVKEYKHYLKTYSK